VILKTESKLKAHENSVSCYDIFLRIIKNFDMIVNESPLSSKKEMAFPTMESPFTLFIIMVNIFII
jgi:hypothetical protein